MSMLMDNYWLVFIISADNAGVIVNPKGEMKGIIFV